MPIRSRLDASLGCTFVVWVGEVTLDEWRAHYDALLSDPAFPPGRSWLLDLRRADVDLFDDAAIEALVARTNAAADQLGGIRMAIVPNGAWHKASRAEQALSVQRLTTLQFTSFDTACVWLGLPIEEATAIVEELRASAGGT